MEIRNEEQVESVYAFLDERDREPLIRQCW